MIPLLCAYYIRRDRTSGLYYKLAELMKHHFASWLSIPYPSGAQCLHTLPPAPPVLVLWVVSLAGGRGAFCAGGVGDVGGTRGVYVSLSRVSATTSAHVSVVPCSVTLVFRIASKSCYIG